MLGGGPENGGRGLFTESIRADSLGREKAWIIMLQSGRPASSCSCLGTVDRLLQCPLLKRSLQRSISIYLAKIIVIATLLSKKFNSFISSN